MKDDSFLLKNEELAKTEIWSRGLHEPIIHKYLNLYQLGELDYTQALQGMVIHLSNAKNNLTNDLMQALKNK